MVLQSHVRKRSAFLGFGKKLKAFKEKAGAGMDFFEVVQIRISGVFYDDVRNHDFSDVYGFFRRGLASRSGKAFLDV